MMTGISSTGGFGGSFDFFRTIDVTAVRGAPDLGSFTVIRGEPAPAAAASAGERWKDSTGKFAAPATTVIVRPSVLNTGTYR